MYRSLLHNKHERCKIKRSIFPVAISVMVVIIMHRLFENLVDIGKIKFLVAASPAIRRRGWFPCRHMHGVNAHSLRHISDVALP